MAIQPTDRLTNVRRKLNDLLLSRRLAGDPERTGVVDLRDFGKRSEALADFAGASVVELAAARGEEAACARRVCEEIELAARLTALIETLPRGPRRQAEQLALLEESARLLEAARQAELLLEEPPALVFLSELARRERDHFAPFVEFVGRIEESPAGLVLRGEVLRLLRRALLEHVLSDEEEPFGLSVGSDGVLRFAGFEIAAEVAAGVAGAGIPRSPSEPPEVKRMLDLREASPDEALRDFLLVKAVDEALAALLAPRLGSGEWLARARQMPRRPGKRFVVRPEAVQRPVAGWAPREAARAVEKLAARRLGPDWARLPKGAYLVRLFLSEDDGLAADLIALGPALRRMEKGEEPLDPGTVRERGERSLRALLGRLG